MPNWCWNDLIVKGKKADVLAFKEKYKGKESDKWIDLDKVISKEEFIAEQQKNWDALDETTRKERWRNDFELYWFNHGGYEWNVNHWGTKWQPEINEPDEHLQIHDANAVEVYEYGIRYGFSSAYSPIDDAVKLLIEQNPNLYFELEYEETGMCFAGELIGENGEVLVDEQYDIDFEECPECEYEMRSIADGDYVCGDCGHKMTKEEVEEKRAKEDEAEE